MSYCPTLIAMITFAVTTTTLSACKEGGKKKPASGEANTTDSFVDDGQDHVVVARHAPSKEMYAADAEYLQKNSNFYFKVWDETFSRRLADLPQNGEVPADKKPVSGGYYPESKGGTGVVMVGGKSPLQKYDEAFNSGSDQAAAWEQDKHTSGPAWAGHCNGYSAAAQRHPKEPSRNVVRNGVTFAPQDVKALMAELHMSADYEFLGGNRCALTSVPTPDDRDDPTVMAECEDINPGTFHAAVTNWLGRMHHTLIMDENAGEQVWNYPVFKYTVQSMTSISEAQAKSYVSGGGSDYVFNPSAVKFTYVEMRLTFAQAKSTETLGQLFTGDFDLSYVLELNAAGEILGGEWVGESQQKHPDFLWVALEPTTPNGTRYMGNPYIDHDEVIKMWAESAGLDPDNPPTDIVRPSGTDDWGHWPAFDVVLDGSATGAVFAGKKTKMRVKRRDGLAAAGVSLEIGLNGNPLATLTGAAGEDLVQTFEPGLGLNRLQLTWKQGSTQIDEQFLRFHVVR